MQVAQLGINVEPAAQVDRQTHVFPADNVYPLRQEVHVVSKPLHVKQLL